MERELRALTQAAVEYPGATRRVLVLTRDQTLPVTVRGVRVQPATSGC